MRLSEFDYDLPEELIAQEPLADRTQSRMLHLERASGAVHHRRFLDLIDLLEPGDLLVVNNSRVTARRLFGHRPTGGKVELLLVGRGEDGSYTALTKPAKKLKPGTRIDSEEGWLAEVLEDLGEGQKRLMIDWGGSDAEHAGEIPLPPYIMSRLADEERYQTVFAQSPGSAAAPTAGLHFTQPVLDRLAEKGVGLAEVTLSVSIDTFRPVQTDDLSEHVMHGEVCAVPPETVEAVRQCTGRVVAVGTTAARTLESFAAGPRELEAGEKTTRLFITPGYDFKILDGLLTNFHMPRTTMLLMISALAGRDAIRIAYDQAVAERYRFLSFGDCMLIL